MDKLWMAQLEGLRGQMMDTANLKQTLLHRDVLMLSQMLDQMIIKVQKESYMKRDVARGEFVYSRDEVAAH